MLIVGEPPPVATNAYEAEQLFWIGAVVVLCIAKDQSRKHCISLAEAKRFFEGQP